MRRFDVVVVAYGSSAHIADALNPLRSMPEVGRIVVVDHGNDGTGEIASALGAIVLSDGRNPGFGAGQNRGVARTDSSFVLLLNPDAVPSPDGVRVGLVTLDARPEVAAVQGVVRSASGGEPERTQGVELGPIHLVGRALGARALLRLSLLRRLASHSRLADHAERAPITAKEVESLAAVAPLMRRSAFDAVGGFDERYFLYGEDLDLCRRLRAERWSLVAIPELWATHLSGASSQSWSERERAWWHGTLRFATQWWSPGAWIVAMVAATIMVIRLICAEPARTAQSLEALLVSPLRQRVQCLRASPAAID